jgi:hypothetical protein
VDLILIFKISETEEGRNKNLNKGKFQVLEDEEMRSDTARG